MFSKEQIRELLILEYKLSKIHLQIHFRFAQYKHFAIYLSLSLKTKTM